MELFNRILEVVINEPITVAALIGLIITSSYLVLLLGTKLGDIRLGIQSFVFSLCMHLALLLFFGATLVLSGDSNSLLESESDKVVPIRQVIVGAKIPEEDPDAVPIWNQHLIDPEVPIKRSELQISNPETNSPERKPSEEKLIAIHVPLPSPDSEEEKPQEVERANESKTEDEPTPVELQSNEETAESRDEVSKNREPMRTERDPGKLDTPSIERENQASLPPRETELPAPVPDRENPEIPNKLDNNPSSETTSFSPAPIESPESGDPMEEGPAQVTKSNPFNRTPRESKTTPRTKVDRQVDPDQKNPFIGLTPDVGSVSPRSSDQRPNVERPTVTERTDQPQGKVPASYQLRNLRKQGKVAVKLGASEGSEEAVERALVWFTRHQDPEGFWDADGFHSNCPDGDRCLGPAGLGKPTQQEETAQDKEARRLAGREADTGLTALVVLCYLGAGYTHEEGIYADQVDRAIRWLIRQQRDDGFLGGEAMRYEQMYCHGIATYALAEACGMMEDPYSDPDLRGALERAVEYILDSQYSDGGWRYTRSNPDGDMSMFGWQLMALKSAEIAGIPIPQSTRTGMQKFLGRVSSGKNKGLASYRPSEQVTPAMTAEALFSRQMLGINRRDPKCIEAVEYLMTRLPRQSQQDLYYWYYGTLAMYQFGGEPWEVWNTQLRDILVKSQRKEGHATGSWDTRDTWSQYGGRIYSTALSTLSLEVYYRFLPLYQLEEGN